MATVLTVILNWRTAEMTLRATETALRALDGISGGLVIVDNDSGDGSFERITSEVRARGWDQGPQAVRVLQSGRNGGFGAGNNVGIKAGLPDGSKPDYVYILNSDAFPEADAIANLVDFIDENQTVGFAGSHIFGEDGVPHQTAFRFPTIASEFEAQARFGPISRALRQSIVTLPMPEKTCRVDWLAGASLMMRQVVLDQIGLFDETFFLYFEETDLARRAAKAGWQRCYVLESRVMHIGSASTGMGHWRRIPQFWLDSRMYYFVKNHGRGYAFAATAAHVLGGLMWRARLLIQRKDPGDPPHYLWNLTTHALSRAAKTVLGGAAASVKPRPTI